MSRRRAARRNSNSCFLRWFRCPDCGLQMMASKHCDSGRDHVKDMWCPTCKRESKFEQFDSDKIHIG